MGRIPGKVVTIDVSDSEDAGELRERANAFTILYKSSEPEIWISGEFKGCDENGREETFQTAQPIRAAWVPDDEDNDISFERGGRSFILLPTDDTTVEIRGFAAGA